VRGEDGSLRVVHNCGVAYGIDGSVELPAGPRMELVHEIVEEAEAKVIVFVPLTGALNTLAEFLRGKGHTVAVVNGATSKAQRDVIFKDFQSSSNPRVLVANAGTMSHGLTLTAANTVVWYAPVHSLETYEQACARVTRPGQKHNTLIVNIEGTPIERAIYKRLQERGTLQGLLLDLVKGKMGR
jgi:SNF2 family DNA or RNA helicase